MSELLRTHPLDLPEIRSIIANNLRHRRDLAFCARVSHDWNDSFTQPLYKSVVLTGSGLRGVGMESFERNQHLIRHLIIHESALVDLSVAAEVQAISSILANPNIVSLVWDHDSIKFHGLKHLFEALKTNSTLITLSLKRNKIGAYSAYESLKTHPALTTLNLQETLIRHRGVTALSNALKTNRVLTTLNLQGNKIGHTEAKELSEVLKINSTLATLKLGDNDIGPDGAQALSEALMTNSTLTTLDLENNNIRCDGTRALSDVLKTNSTLTTLDLKSNKIGLSGAQALFEAVQTNSTLIILNLAMNNHYEIGNILKALHQTLGPRSLGPRSTVIMNKTKNPPVGFSEQ